MKIFLSVSNEVLQRLALHPETFNILILKLATWNTALAHRHPLEMNREATNKVRNTSMREKRRQGAQT